MSERIEALKQAVEVCRKRSVKHTQNASEYRPARASEAELCALQIETLIRLEEKKTVEAENVKTENGLGDGAIGAGVCADSAGAGSEDATAFSCVDDRNIEN